MLKIIPGEWMFYAHTNNKLTVSFVLVQVVINYILCLHSYYILILKWFNSQESKIENACAKLFTFIAQKLLCNTFYTRIFLMVTKLNVLSYLMVFK